MSGRSLKDGSVEKPKQGETRLVSTAVRRGIVTGPRILMMFIKPDGAKENVYAPAATESARAVALDHIRQGAVPI